MVGKQLLAALQEKRQELIEARLPAIASVTTISAATATAPTAAPVATPPAAIPAAAPAWPTTTTAASPFSLGPCFVHYQVAPAKVLAVEGVHGAISVFIIVYFHKRKPARLPGEPVTNQINA
jgi:hypothetical protein